MGRLGCAQIVNLLPKTWSNVGAGATTVAILNIGPSDTDTVLKIKTLRVVLQNQSWRVRLFGDFRWLNSVVKKLLWHTESQDELLKHVLPQGICNSNSSALWNIMTDGDSRKDSKLNIVINMDDFLLYGRSNV